MWNPVRPDFKLKAFWVFFGLVPAFVGCGADTSADSSDAPAADALTDPSTSTKTSVSEIAGAADELYPDVVGATVMLSEDGTWTVSATLSSPYDTAERYADAWRVTGPGGEVYGIRELAHDHAGEQPFTRSQSGITIPNDVDSVTVEGRDQLSGWGGKTVTVSLDKYRLDDQ